MAQVALIRTSGVVIPSGVGASAEFAGPRKCSRRRADAGRIECNVWSRRLRCILYILDLREKGFNRLLLFCSGRRRVFASECVRAALGGGVLALALHTDVQHSTQPAATSDAVQISSSRCSFNVRGWACLGGASAS